MKFSFETYFANISSCIELSEELLSKLELFTFEVKACSNRGGKVILMGNGGSSSIASHVSVDLSKNARIRAITFNEVNLITCLANDYGHDNWMKAALEIHSEPNDLLILISSSGESKNVLNAAKFALSTGLQLVTLSGMGTNNSLLLVNRQGLNLNVVSRSYNVIENVHQIWLLGVVDSCIGTSDYPAA